MIRRLLALLVAVGAVLAVADVGLRLYAQDRIAGHLERSLHLDGKASVSLEGVPFLLHLATGEFPAAGARGTGLELGGLTFQSVGLELRDVRFSRARVLTGTGGTLQARAGRGFVTIAEDELTRALHRRGVDVAVRLQDGAIRVLGDRLPRPVEVRASISGRRLELRPIGRALPGSVALRLPRLVKGLAFTSVQVEGRTLLISFDLEEPSFPLA